MFLIRNIFIFSLIIFEINSYSSQWFCKEGASKKIEDTYEVCGIGIDKDEDTARKNALRHAFEEFDLICNKSDECRGKYKEIVPLRVDCEKSDANKYTCYRAINISIDRERIVDENLNNKDKYESIITETSEKEREKNAAIILGSKEKKRKYNFDKDIYMNNTNNIIIFFDIKTKKTVTGNAFSIHKNGKVERIFNFKDGLIDGFCRYYFENGKIRREILYKKGIPYGSATSWNEDGKINSVFIIQSNQDFLDIEIKNYYDNNNIKYSFNAKKIPLKEWYKFEFIEKVEPLDAIKYLLGEFRLYHENGKIKQSINLLNGKFEGKLISFYNTGELETEFFYKNGILHGEYKRYSVNKYLSETGFFCNGIRCGLHQIFYDTGELNSEYQYINGKKEGKGIFYLKDSNICAIFVFKNNILISAQTNSGRTYNRAELINCRNTWKCPCS